MTTNRRNVLAADSLKIGKLILSYLPSLSSCKNFPPTFSMVHLFRRLYGVDAPGSRCPVLDKSVTVTVVAYTCTRRWTSQPSWGWVAGTSDSGARSEGGSRWASRYWAQTGRLCSAGDHTRRRRNISRGRFDWQLASPSRETVSAGGIASSERRTI